MKMTRKPADRPPVLVLGSGLSALGAARVLGRAGLRAFVLTDADDWIRRSRWFRAAPPAGAATHDAGLARYLSALDWERAVLLPCSDHWARQVAGLDSGLAERFPSSIARPAALETMLDKGRFAAALAELAVPHPATYRLESVADLERLPDDAFRDTFLKPRDSLSFFRRYAVKAFRVHGREDAARRAAELTAAGFELVLQEYVPGPPDSHYFVDGFVDRTGRIRALLARRRRRIYPPDFGNSTYLTSVPLDEAAGAVETIRRLVAGTGYRGMFSAEFKRDANDGRFKILELNARAWWYVEFAARCGVDVCSMAYRDALGRSVESVERYTVGKSCVYWYPDYFACRALHREGRLSLRQWTLSWLGATAPIFHWDDPLPAALDMLRLGRSALRRALRRTPSLAAGRAGTGRAS